VARLNWDVLGERFFETGIDRGVLYIDGQGVAWPGLISVAESPTGGEAKPRYIDGYKYLNLAAAEEFEATITAFFSPPEFARCDGRAEIHPGLFATHQPRRTFDFSYRSKIGNDQNGTDHAYKIHLIYNALAAPADRTYETLDDETEPMTHEWSITTRPPQIFGYRPTSHFVIDSRTTPEATLTTLEDILYGSAEGLPQIPTATSLIDIFASGSVDLETIVYEGGDPSSVPTRFFDGGGV